ncbi:MAG: carboxypeptidase-like regulatory domain-containing protein [Bacteroidales bacterium]|nr:carboxypeptidase-like regulatory domain-containing protein [Bacteroidales bacterium]
MKKSCHTLLFLLWSLMVHSQTISGRVYDELDSLLPGVTIIEVGDPSNYAFTNLEGRFKIDAHSDTAVFSFTYVGYLEEKIRIDTLKDLIINVKLMPEILDLEEINLIWGRSQNTISIGYYGSLSNTPWGIITGQHYYYKKSYPKSVYSRAWFTTDFRGQYEGFLELSPWQINTGDSRIRFDLMLNYLVQHKQHNDFSDYLISTDILNRHLCVKTGYGIRVDGPERTGLIQLGVRKNFSGFMPDKFNLIDHVQIAVNTFTCRETFDYKASVWFEIFNSNFYIGLARQKFYYLAETTLEVRYFWSYY